MTAWVLDRPRESVTVTEIVMSPSDESGLLVVKDRHGVAHGWYSHYPNKKAALNAILFTGFILNLEPLICEEV